MVGREAFEHELPPLLTEASPEVVAGQQPTYRCGESDGIVRRNEQTGLTVLNRLGGAADVGRDDRRPTQQRLEDSERESLEPRRQREDVERPKVAAGVVAPTGPCHTVCDTDRPRELLERPARAALADEHQGRVVDVGERADQRVEALLELE